MDAFTDIGWFLYISLDSYKVFLDNIFFTELWAVVNNAGIWSWGHTEWVSMKQYKRLAEVNIYGTIRVTQALLPLIRRSKGNAELCPCK